MNTELILDVGGYGCIFKGTFLSINITKSKEKLFKSALEWEQQFLYANGTKIYQFNAKDPKIKPYPLCLGNISKYFLLDNMTIRKHG